MRDVESKLPRHVAVIMDGNGRWAKRKLLPRLMGHKKGAKVFKTISSHCKSLGIKYFTVYAFSTENWRRSQEEISGLMDILREYLKDFFVYKEDYIGYRTKFIGDKSIIEPDIVDLMEKIEKESEQYDDININIAINYGARQEILSAVKQILSDINLGIVDETQISLDDISNRLYTANQPDPDLLIRTGCEKRLSNFLLWQSAYTELFFTDVLWPDFSPDCFDMAIAEFKNRQRRFGGV